MVTILKLNLDELYSDGYYYTKFDQGDSGHEIYIHDEDVEEFLDEFAAEWRRRAKEYLTEAVELDDE